MFIEDLVFSEVDGVTTIHSHSQFGSYKLVEKTAPTGYIRNTLELTFEIEEQAVASWLLSS